MNEIVRLSPDIIFSTVVGKSTVHLYQAYADFGFDPRNMPIASLTTTEAEIRAMGAGVGKAISPPPRTSRAYPGQQTPLSSSATSAASGVTSPQICAWRRPIFRFISLRVHLNSPIHWTRKFCDRWCLARPSMHPKGPYRSMQTAVTPICGAA